MGVGPERIREINSLRILHWLIDGSETTATEIAEHCDLSRTSVNAALANLRELGWITTLNAVTGTAGGRPARRYRFRSEGAVVLGADIGVHHVEVLLADLAGTALAQRSQAVDPDLDPPSRLAVLDQLIAEALSQAQLKAEDVHALTAAVSGVVDDSGRTPFETPLPQWHEVDLVARLRASFTCPVRISNSCKLALLEETRHGEAVGFTDVVHILADQRISAAIMSRGAVLICRLDPARHPELLESLRERGITALALDVVPRISRAQSLDVLSSQANLAGYRAVIEAASHLGRLFSGQVTAAGKFPPATVYVIGAGVAGLSAIGTACSLGAQVRGSDVRPEVADQVRSMGAQFVPLPSAQEVSSDGYAKEMSADQASAANALYAQQAAESDVVITTASIPGRRAPVLLDRSAIEAMRPGSVIIDMAAATGGNTELTVPGQVVTTDGGVTIVGHTDLAGMLPAQATQLYGRNIVNLLGLVTPDKDGTLALDLHDEVVRAITVTHDGELLWPPPPIQVSATPAPGRR